MSKASRKADVLVTYGWVRSSYAALRNLTDHGLTVCASDSSRIGMCQYSHRKSGFELYPSHYANEEAFISRVTDICNTRDIFLILPSHNETEVLAKHKHCLPRNVAALLPDSVHCEVFNNKAKSYDFARSVGVPVPFRFDYKRPSLLAQDIKNSSLRKTVIKLLTGNSAKGVFYADTPAAAQDIVEKLIATYKLSEDRYPQVEEYVEGEGWGSSVLYWCGERIAGFTHRRLREKISTGGTSTLRESAQNLALEISAKRIFDAIGWHGLAMAEFKVCSRTGRHWFIEVNPRMWGSISLPIRAGVEFPYLAWLCATQGPEAARILLARVPGRHPWRARWLFGDLMLAGRDLVSGEIRDAARGLFRAGADSIDDFFWDDPLVFAGEALYYAVNVIAKRSLNPAEQGMLG